MKPSRSNKETRTQKEPADPDNGIPTLVRRIKAGDIATAGLSKKQRQHHADDLTAEGYSTGEIAEFLGVTTRTIRRDLGEIRAAYAVERDPQTVREMVGGLSRQADIAIDRIRRAVRPKTVKPSDRIEAEHTCWKIWKQHIEILQRLGYLPNSATSSPTVGPQNVSSLYVIQRMISQAQDEKLEELGIPPNTPPAIRLKLLKAVRIYAKQKLEAAESG